MTEGTELAVEIHAIDEATDEALVEMAQGCREQSCLYHGAVNQERARRQRVARDADCLHLPGCDGRSHQIHCNEAFYGGPSDA